MSEVPNLHNDPIRDGASVKIPDSSLLEHKAITFSLYDPKDVHGVAMRDHKVSYRYSDKDIALMANRMIHDIRIWAR